MKAAVWTEPVLRSRSKWPGRLLLAVMVVAVAPLVWDGLKVCAANWMAINGRYLYIETPVFDGLVDLKREIARQAWQVLGPIVREPPWGAGTTIAIACGWVLVLMWLFRTRQP